MRIFAFSFASLVVVAACGGDTSTTTDGGPDGSQNDGAGSDVVTKPDGNPIDSSPGDGSSGDGSTTDGGGGDGGGGVSVKCGNTSCPLPSESCCVDPGAQTYTCYGEGGTCAGGNASLKCNSAADCPTSQVCCLDATVDPAIAACSTTCTGTDHAMLCDPNGTANANRCGDAGACGNTNIDTWQLTTTSGTCGDLTGPF